MINNRMKMLWRGHLYEAAEKYEHIPYPLLVADFRDVFTATGFSVVASVADCLSSK